MKSKLRPPLISRLKKLDRCVHMMDPKIKKWNYLKFKQLSAQSMYGLEDLCKSFNNRFAVAEVNGLWSFRVESEADAIMLKVWIDGRMHR